jgi:hypothetical protein
MAGFIAMAEVLEAFGLVFSGLTILMLIQRVFVEGLVLLIMAATCFTIAILIARQTRAKRACQWCLACGGRLEGDPPACPRCEVQR